MIKFKIVIVFLMFLVSCKGQVKQSEIPNSNIMALEKFDIEQFNKDRMVFQKEEQYNGSFAEKKMILDDIVDTLSNGIRRRFVDEDGYTELLVPNKGFWSVYKNFYLTGILKEKKDKQCIIDGYIPCGKEYYYDSNGKLTKEIDNEKLYKNLSITPDRLFDLLDEKDIYDKTKRLEGVLYVWFTARDAQKNPFPKIKFSEDDLPFWEVIREFTDPKSGPYEKVYKIDAKTGNIKEVNDPTK